MAKSPPARQRPKATSPAPTWIKLDGSAPYADMVRITTSDRHVLVTFGQSRPGENPKREAPAAEVVVVAQVYLPPKTAGEFLAILGDHVTKYEEHFGTGILPDGVSIQIDEEQSQ